MRNIAAGNEDRLEEGHYVLLVVLVPPLHKKHLGYIVPYNFIYRHKLFNLYLYSNARLDNSQQGRLICASTRATQRAAISRLRNVIIGNHKVSKYSSLNGIGSLVQSTRLTMKQTLVLSNRDITFTSTATRCKRTKRRINREDDDNDDEDEDEGRRRKERRRRNRSPDVGDAVIKVSGIKCWTDARSIYIIYSTYIATVTDGSAGGGEEEERTNPLNAPPSRMAEMCSLYKSWELNEFAAAIMARQTYMS